MTSSSDKMARIWKVDETSGHINIESIKSFPTMLMNSKFNKAKQGEDYLIATGGHSGIVSVWKANDSKDVAKLNHSQSDPSLEGLEIDWQNNRSLAVTGKSKNIYLWDISTPMLPSQVWSGGHTGEVE